MSKKLTSEQLKNQNEAIEKLAQFISLEGLSEIRRDLAEAQSLIKAHPLLQDDPFHCDSLVSTLHQLELCFREISIKT